MEGAACSRRGGVKSTISRAFAGLSGGYPSISQGPGDILGEAEDEEGEESEETEVAGAPEASEAVSLAHSNKPFVSQAGPNFLKMMEKMTQFMGKLIQEIAPRDNSKAPTFKTPSMKEPDSFNGTQAHKLRGFIQSFKYIFHNYSANFFSDQKKVLSSTSFLTGRAGSCIEPYLTNISNEDPSYLLNNWQFFETQLFTLFGDPNEVRKAEQELDNLRMKESSHVSLYIVDFRSLITFDTLQELINVTFELDTRYHERQGGKGSNKEKKPPVPGSNPSRPPQGSSSKRPHNQNNRKGKQFLSSKDKPHAACLNNDNKLIDSEKERRIIEGLFTHCGRKHPIEQCFKRPQNKPGSSRGFPSKKQKA
ncbi:hypothetical protein O181_022493 [Austropuccinia psidii MF-1]|uniref:Retrotransposon gag domain-containing protein n=1 Tax=Austropuccinia psidii MF-1 TaxID=1389203 RepID=A0A9Q3CFA4_9BASI|nr:hypothetical protein [Austropuccinia psidii MF-1]